MKKNFSFLALLMAGCLAAGCSGGGAAPTTAPANAAAASAPAAQQPTDAPAEEPIPEADDQPYSFSLFGNIAPELKNGDQLFFADLMEKTNTTIDVQLPPSSNYDESLTIMMASGDYPDLVLFPSEVDRAFKDGVTDGAIIPVNNYIKNAPNLMKYTYQTSWDVLKTLGDDNIYGIPRTSIARADGYAIRQDWLDKLGIAFEEGKPITRDKFTEILTAFTNNDPDGNGANDTYGLGLSTGDGNLELSPPIAWSFGIIGWQKYDNEDYPYMNLQHSKKNDNFKRALEYVNYLFTNRLIDPDWPVTNTDAQDNRFFQGITGVKPEFAGWMPDRQTSLQNVNPDGKIAYIVSVVEKEGDKGQGGSFSTGLWGQWAIMATAKEPQKIVDVLDYMLSDEYWENVKYGLEGVAWNLDADGNKIAIPDHGYAGGRAILRRNNDPGFFVGLNTAVADRTRVSDLIGLCIDQAIFSHDAGYRAPVQDDPTFIDADKAYKIAISKIISGDLPLSAYDEELDKWYQAGGQTYVEQVNAYIASKQ